MHFFRSEEHLSKWEGFNEQKRGGIIALSDLMKLFSGPYFAKRMEPDYFTRRGDYLAEMVSTLDSLTNAGTYWRMGRFEKFGVSLARKLGMV
jgi:hypothetical protein